MKRSLLIITLLVVVGAFAGFQQYSSWSLNRSQNNNAEKTQAGAEQSSPRPGRGRRPGSRWCAGRAVSRSGAGSRCHGDSKVGSSATPRRRQCRALYYRGD